MQVSKAIASLQIKVPGARFHAAPGDVDILVNNAGWFEPKSGFRDRHYNRAA